MYEKLTKFPNFTKYLPEKMPEFYMIVARKVFFLNLGEGRCPPAAVSYAWGSYTADECSVSIASGA